MAFSDDAIGFYLEMEDSSLTRTLATAEKSYDRYTRSLEKYNKRAFESSSRGLARVEELVEAVEELPATVADSLAKAEKTLAKGLKPITQKVNLELTVRSEQKLRRAVGEAVVKAMSGASIRLGPTRPAKRMQMFDTSVSLRAAYESLPQPPDMRGKITPRKFAKGGVADGPEGIDKIPAMLTKGEIVLPPDVSEALLKAAAQLGGKGGADVDEVAKSLNDLAFVMSERVAKAADQVNDALEETNERGEEITGTFKQLFAKILSPARFLAIQKAVSDVSDGVKQLGSGVSDAFGKAGGDEIQDFFVSMNMVNQRLGLTRDELRAFKQEAIARADETGAELNAMGNSINALADAGIRSREQLLLLAPAVTNMAVATGTSVDKLSDAAFRLEGAYGFTENQINATFDNIRKFSQNAAKDAGELTDELLSNLQNMSNRLEQETTQDQQMILSNMARLSAALSDNWQGAGTEISGVISRALGGEQDALIQMQKLLQTGPEEVMERLRSGDLEGIMAGLQQQIQALQGNELGLRKLQEVLGFQGSAQDFQLLGTRADEFGDSLARLGEHQHTLESVKDAQNDLTRAADNQRTIFDRLRDGFNKYVAQQTIGGVAIGEMIDLTKEFNAGTLISIAFLAKWGLQAVVTAGKFTGKLAKGLLSVTGLLGGKSGKGGVAGGLAGLGKGAGGLASATGGAGGGLFAGLSGGLQALGKGLTAFGTAMLGPGGLGLLAAVGAILALAGAARIAAPALEILGNVVMHAIDGFVEMFKSFITLDVKEMLAAGPALLGMAAGVTALAAGVGAYGVALGAAAVGAAAFAAAMGITGGLREGGLVGAIEMLVSDLEPLNKLTPRLTGINQTLGMVVEFLKGFAAIGGLLAGLSAGSIIGNTVSGFLGLLGFDSPMDQLAKNGRGMVSTVMRLMTDFEQLAGVGPERLEGINKTMGTMVGFMADYAKLSTAIDELPGTGLLSDISSAIGGLFGADSPAEKLVKQAGPIVEAMEGLLTKFGSIQGLVQPALANPISPEQLQSVVSATLEGQDNELVAEQARTNELLEEVVMLLKRGQDRATQAPVAPGTQILRGPTQGSQFANDVAGGNY